MKYKDCLLPLKVLENNTYKTIIYENEQIEVCLNYYEGFKDIIDYELYYSFNIKNRHNHVHSFEEVIENLYKYPETFSIDKKDFILYSNQELKYLKRLQKFLQFCNLKDINEYSEDIMVNRIKNSDVKKYINLKKINRKYAKEIINKNIKKEILMKDNHYPLKSYDALLIDDDYNILGIINVKEEKIILKDIEETEFNYKLLGYTSFNEYLKYLKIENENDYIIINNYFIK